MDELTTALNRVAGLENALRAVRAVLDGTDPETKADSDAAFEAYRQTPSYLQDPGWYSMTKPTGTPKALRLLDEASNSPEGLPAPAGEWANIPLDLARTVVDLGDVAWAASDVQDADAHGRMVADSVCLTAAHFGQPDEPRRMEWLCVEGTDTVVAYVGTSPNSANVARALAGAWNLLREHCHEALAAASGQTSQTAGEGRREGLVFALLLVAATACAPAPLRPARPWGDAEVVVVVQTRDCTVYGLASDPQHVYWPICGDDR